MPRLFDLLPENDKNRLLAESRKNRAARIPPKKGAPAKKTVEQPHATPTIMLPDFVALDVETTGLDFKQDRIIEIGAVKFRNGKAVEEYSTFIQANTPIPPLITDLTGITDADLATAPTFGDIADKLLIFIDNLPLCGHQIEFDVTFLKEELKRIGRPAINGKVIDTALLSRILLQPQGRFSLKFVSSALGITLNSAHRALHDARASGEVAIQLIPKLAELPDVIRQTMAACAPNSLFKNLLFQTLQHLKPLVLFSRQAAQPLPRLTPQENAQPLDRSAVEQLFTPEGPLAKTLPAFSPRSAQTTMALRFTDAINTNSILVAEAGTGTGKTLAYLAPAALWAIQNHSRVIISTRTRNLQDQLIGKDIPTLAAITENRLKASVLKGRRNYLCLHRFKRMLLGEMGNLSPRERFAILPLIPWAHNSTTGDIEEQNQFNPKWFAKIWNLISAENHECTGRRCPRYQLCFFQQARNRALGSHIVIINHALFFSDVCSENSFLGKIDTIIFDEAHHLESSGHRFLRVELDTMRINLFAEVINNLVLRIAGLTAEQEIYDSGRELRTTLKNLRKVSADLLTTLRQWGETKQPNQPDFQLPYHDEPFATTPEAVAFEQTLTTLSDRLYTLKQAIIGNPKAEEFESLATETQSCAERTSQLKSDVAYLLAAKTEDHVFWIEGNVKKGWVKLAGVPIDIGSMLATIWNRTEGGILFTSATLSIAQSVDYFRKAVGLLPLAERTTVELFKSPFTAAQSLLVAQKSGPDPDSPQFAPYVAEAISRLHTKHNKNILVLFTANSMLANVYTLLRESHNIPKSSLLAQGMSGSRQIILDEFKKGDHMILLGTDSFWEGVDIPGDGCEIVIIPRLPFPVPTHPLTQAIAQRFERLGGESFFSYSIPEAVIKFRQGAGRLIRTTADRGVLMVLDHRIASRGYGKQFTRSLNGEFQIFDDFDSMLKNVTIFFEADSINQPESVRYVPLEDA